MDTSAVVNLMIIKIMIIPTKPPNPIGQSLVAHMNSNNNCANGHTKNAQNGPYDNVHVSIGKNDPEELGDKSKKGLPVVPGAKPTSNPFPKTTLLETWNSNIDCPQPYKPIENKNR